VQVFAEKADTIVAAAALDDALLPEDTGSDTASEMEPTSGEDGLDEVLKDLKAYRESLMDLVPALQMPARDAVMAERTKGTSADAFWDGAEASRPYVANVKDKHPSTDPTPIKGHHTSDDTATNHVPPSIPGFEILKPLSKSEFANIYLSKSKHTGAAVAIKVLKKCDMIAKNKIINMTVGLANMRVWKSLIPRGEGKSHVLELFWIFGSKDYLYLIMRNMWAGDCASLVNSQGRLAKDLARIFAAELVLAIIHLHGQGIVHHDLTPGNIMIDRRGHLKLVDYGLSQAGLIGRQQSARENRRLPLQVSSTSYESLEDLSERGLPFEHEYPASTASEHSSALFDPEGENTEFFGTPDYLAPEIIKGDTTDEKCDFWSLGCIIFYFLLGCTPFRADTTDQVFRNILSGAIDWPMEVETVSSNAVMVIVGLLARDPKERLDAEKVKSLRWFAKLNWDTLLHGQNTYMPEPKSITYAEHRNVASVDLTRGKDRLSTGYEYETNLLDRRRRTEFLATGSTRSPVKGQASLPPKAASAAQTAAASATSKGKSSLSNLHRHAAAQQRKQPSSCTVCGQWFSREDYRPQHMEKAHNISRSQAE
jgi:serine/threonine protein kinase